MKVIQHDKRAHRGAVTFEPESVSEREILDSDSFQRMITLERKRSERSGNPFVLMLLEGEPLVTCAATRKALHRAAKALSLVTRETDVVGWYAPESAVGVLLIELAGQDPSVVTGTMHLRAKEILREDLPADVADRIQLSFHVFPEAWNPESHERPRNPKLYPDLQRQERTRRLRAGIKRGMDFLVSLLLLTLGIPLFLLLAAAIKLTSKGPVFYRQQRLGQYGISFPLLKFRSMYVDNDSSAHKEYVRRMIAGVAKAHPGKRTGEVVYKLTRDPRITPLGAILRRTSLDELPQFINVLKGEMSLVGPRPPIAYEFENYKVWHRRRVFEAKPGITGLWQVNGRNRIGFDDMVRLDLQYARSWSPWLDLKILFRTPKAMVEGAH